MQSLVSPLSNGNPTTRISLPAILVVTKGNHISTPILLAGDGFYPLFRGFRLKETLKQLVNLTRIGLRGQPCQRRTSNGTFIETVVDSVNSGHLQLPKNVR